MKVFDAIHELLEFAVKANGDFSYLIKLDSDCCTRRGWWPVGEQKTLLKRKGVDLAHGPT
jgi:hypothetical protein